MKKEYLYVAAAAIGAIVLMPMLKKGDGFQDSQASAIGSSYNPGNLNITQGIMEKLYSAGYTPGANLINYESILNNYGYNLTMYGYMNEAGELI